MALPGTGGGTRTAVSRPLIIAAMATVYLVWGSTYLAIRFALKGYPPVFFPGVRYLLAGCLMLIVLKMRGVSLPTARQWCHCAVIGFLLLLIGNGGVVYAEQNVGSGLAATAIATVPLWAAVIGSLMGSVPARMQWIGLAIGFAGIVELNLSGDLSGNRVSSIVLLVAAMSWALGSVISKKMNLPQGLMNPAAQMSTAGLMFLATSAVRGEHWVLFPSVGAAAAVLYLVVFGSLIAYSAYIYLIHNTSPALATSYAYVNPVVAVVLGVVFGGETVGKQAVIAIVLVLTGVTLIVTFNSRKAH